VRNCRRADLEALRQEKERNGEPEVDETKSRMNPFTGKLEPDDEPPNLDWLTAENVKVA
jgi:hypothetical protein